MKISSLFNSLVVILIHGGVKIHVQSFDCKQYEINGFSQPFCAKNLPTSPQSSALTYKDRVPPRPGVSRGSPGTHNPPIKPDYGITSPRVVNGENTCNPGEAACCDPGQVKVATQIKFDFYHKECHPVS
ncbi:hypothetical protein MJO28_006793 [Puccinia striiformis f. sp. tritici]|uniref:Uncharacterized protein n=1 Tax=Puccinia striiformis f. sp. tritici TaxID=168172 RepID=A0ACC0EK07_9BASI|nr:hypothetical protein Pst134EA_011973 [Puccinia striiformis f. sp. tritici]KAI9631244.1 hypothetical protein KEM48_013173 [Puccinia striiformis f. sp. tritici PST-130]KAH9456725.1 hypothetical protein Pst134EB_012930 [Puccinia striiformis f. sp. tritici]KAH9468350.1 hypothetical protein Pst134EA_011973 [Puccinia striiformis f. sp. tritici]KAI7954246.1 hypothetical protein MJO28_006793 [Puccinia striiformis f. sp. tritici]KAI7958552.1 hypothetical protein MJO29_006769 [Puccinia striiformis f.